MEFWVNNFKEMVGAVAVSPPSEGDVTKGRGLRTKGAERLKEGVLAEKS